MRSIRIFLRPTAHNRRGRDIRQQRRVSLPGKEFTKIKYCSPLNLAAEIVCYVVVLAITHFWGQQGVSRYSVRRTLQVAGLAPDADYLCLLISTRNENPLRRDGLQNPLQSGLSCLKRLPHPPSSYGRALEPPKPPGQGLFESMEESRRAVHGGEGCSSIGALRRGNGGLGLGWIFYLHGTRMHTHPKGAAPPRVLSTQPNLPAPKPPEPGI